MPPFFLSGLNVQYIAGNVLLVITDVLEVESLACRNLIWMLNANVPQQPRRNMRLIFGVCEGQAVIADVVI